MGARMALRIHCFLHILLNNSFSPWSITQVWVQNHILLNLTKGKLPQLQDRQRINKYSRSKWWACENFNCNNPVVGRRCKNFNWLTKTQVKNFSARQQVQLECLHERKSAENNFKYLTSNPSATRRTVVWKMKCKHTLRILVVHSSLNSRQ